MQGSELLDILFHFNRDHFVKNFHLLMKNDRYFLVWNIVLFLIWTVLRIIYVVVAKALFKRFTKKTEVESDRFVDTSWNFCFYGISTPLGILSLEPGKTLEEHLKVGMANRTSSVVGFQCPRVDWNSLFVDKTIYIALMTAFFLHSAFETFNRTKKHWPEIILKIFFCAFLLATYKLSNWNFTIAFITLVGVPRLVYELSKLLFSFGSFTHSVCIKYLSYFSLVIYSIFWVHIYVWMLPGILDYKNQMLLEYVILSLLIFVLYGVELITGPVSRVLFSLFLNKTFGLEYYLYGTNLFGKPLYVIKREMIEYERKMRKLREDSLRSIEEKTEEPLITCKSRENTVALYQTVKCYIRMRKKLKAIRKQIEERKQKQTVTQTDSKKEV